MRSLLRKSLSCIPWKRCRQSIDRAGFIVPRCDGREAATQGKQGELASLIQSLIAGGFFGTFSTPECLLAFGNICSTTTTYETAVIVALCDAQPFPASTLSWSFVSAKGRLLLREQTKSCKRRPARLRNSYSENPTSLVGKKSASESC